MKNKNLQLKITKLNGDIKRKYFKNIKFANQIQKDMFLLTFLKSISLKKKGYKHLKKKNLFYKYVKNQKYYINWVFQSSIKKSSLFIEEVKKKKRKVFFKRIFFTLGLYKRLQFRVEKKPNSSFSRFSFLIFTHRLGNIQRMYSLLNFFFKKGLFYLKGPIGVKQPKSLITLLRSPHINKKHRDQFYYVKKNVFLQILIKYHLKNSSIIFISNIILFCLKKYLPSGCEMKINQYSIIPFTFYSF